MAKPHSPSLTTEEDRWEISPRSPLPTRSSDHASYESKQEKKPKEADSKRLQGHTGSKDTTGSKESTV